MPRLHLELCHPGMSSNPSEEILGKRKNGYHLTLQIQGLVLWTAFYWNKYLGFPSNTWLCLLWLDLTRKAGDGDEPTRFYWCLLGNKQTLALLAYWHSHGPYQLAVVKEGVQVGRRRSKLQNVSSERLRCKAAAIKTHDTLPATFHTGGFGVGVVKGLTPRAALQGEKPLRACSGRPYSKLSKACCLTVKSVRCRSVTRKLGRILCR